jgi:site-specific DNA-methyltransferase (adenine-specific)
VGQVIDLRCGKYQDALADIGKVDAVIVDPPFSERVHSKQFHGPRLAGRGIISESHSLGYAHWGGSEIEELVVSWSQRCVGWICVFTSHDLVDTYTRALEGQGRYVFAPIACVRMYRNVRLSGDGPSNWTDYLVVSRPRSMSPWGALPGAYVGNKRDREDRNFGPARIVVGSKPLWLMSAIIRDYSRPGDLVCDPCAGGATTLIAAAIEGRRAIGSEMDPNTFKKAQDRIAAGYTPLLDFDKFTPAAAQGEAQPSLFARESYT